MHAMRVIRHPHRGVVGTTRRRRSDLRSLPSAQASPRANAGRYALRHAPLQAERCVGYRLQRSMSSIAALRRRRSGHGRCSLHSLNARPARRAAPTGQGPGASGRAKNHTKRGPFLARPASEACADPWEKHWVAFAGRASPGPWPVRRCPARRPIRPAPAPKPALVRRANARRARRARMVAPTCITTAHAVRGSGPRRAWQARRTCPCECRARPRIRRAARGGGAARCTR